MQNNDLVAKGRELEFLNRFDLSKAVAFFDFDNTITPFDTLDKIIESFAIDQKWVALEDAWKAGTIGSKECLEGQLKSVKVSEEVLTEFLAATPMDRAFNPLVSLLKTCGIESIIVSDGFSFIIKKILQLNGSAPIQVFANEIKFSGHDLIPSFPYQSSKCKRCAHCKKIHLSAHAGKTIIYVGDGLSDVCPAEHAHIVFAKDTLLAHMKAIRKPCLEFTNLGDIYQPFKQSDLAKHVPVMA